MYCPRCTHDNPDGAKFCGECGAKLEYLCPSCGRSNPPINKFCYECGQRLTQPAAPARSTSPRSPGKEGAEVSYTLGDPESIRNAEINLGDAYLLLGDIEQAQQYMEKIATPSSAENGAKSG